MEVLVVLVALFTLAGLLVFVRWERRRILRAARTDTPASSVVLLALLGVAFMMVLLAATQWLAPPQPPITGRWSLLWRTLNESLGPYGPAAFTAVIAGTFGVAAVVARAGRLPTRVDDARMLAEGQPASENLGRRQASDGLARVDELVKRALELEQRGKLDEAATRELVREIQSSIERAERQAIEEQARFEAALVETRGFVLPKRYRVPMAVVALLVVVGFGLELSIGTRFIFAHAAEYRRVQPWLFGLLVPAFAVLWWKLIRSQRIVLVRFPTGWVRWLIMYPLIVAITSAMVAVSPLGWAALLGRFVRSHPGHWEARVVSIDNRPGSRGCDLPATLAMDGYEFGLCLENRVEGTIPRVGQAVVVHGRNSAFGTVVDRVSLKP